MRRSGSKRVFVRLGAIVGLVVVGFGIAGCGGVTAVRPVEIGERAPEFSLTALDGARQSLAAYRGQPLVLNFWATWCQPCHQEIPDLRALDASGQIQVLSVAIDEQGAEVVRPFVEEQSIGYPVLIDDRRVFAEAYGGITIPFTLILDAEHVIRKIYRSPVEEDDVLADLARLSAGVGAIGS